jgi:hypothetical protein
MADPIIIGREHCRLEAEEAHGLIVDLGLPELVAEADPGRWGITEPGLAVLDALELALAAATETQKNLQHLIAGDGEGFAQPRTLAAEELYFLNLFATYVAAVTASEAATALLEGRLRVENTFDLGEVGKVVKGAPSDLPRRLAADLEAYVRHHRRAADASLRVDSAASLARCFVAYFRLLGDTVTELAQDAALRRLNRALEETEVVVLGRRFTGFAWRPEGVEDAGSGLLEVTVDEIVGNQDYLQACLRTARDVAGFDFATGTNPKTINPVLFALGRPGCGKTVTAHAVGNYFLDFCRQRGVRARFLPIRRTDWASSYQNASANSLVRLFTEQVGGFDGVVAVYWPDIDTAFAARDDPRIRSEEKNILGACFGVFDGTLLAKNGKWFMMADANTMHMDEATVSRITQEPFILNGAETAAEMVQLMRDVKLRRHLVQLALDDDQWLEVGRRCRELELSGRAIDNIARKVITEIERFEYPDEYFAAFFAGRRQIIERLSRTLRAADVLAIVDRYGSFELASEERARRERHDRRVEEIVFNLSAEHEALARARRGER